LLLAALAGASVLGAQALDDRGSGSAAPAGAKDAPDIVVTAMPGVDLTPLTKLPGLAASSGPYTDAQSSIRHDGREITIRLEARPNGVVVDGRLASRLQVQPGDRVRLTGVDGRIPVRVSAVAPGAGPPVVYVPSRLLSTLAPNRSTHGSSLSLRLDEPGRAQEYRRWVERQFPGGQVTVVTPASGS
jgi:hypothetical protein